MKTRDPVAVTSRPMTIRELLEVADGARIELSPDAVAVIADSRAVVESVLASGRGAYGLNLGLGQVFPQRDCPNNHTCVPCWAKACN